MFDGFEGWEPSEKWGDPSLLVFDHDKDVQAIALVVEPRWKDEVATFLLFEFRSIPFGFFTDEASARVWLEEVVDA